MSTTPNHAPTAPNILHDEERAVYDVAKLNEWRTRQYGILHSLQFSNGVYDPEGLRRFDQTIEETLNDYLRENNIDETSENYDEVRALFRDASVDNITESEWGNSPASRGVDTNDHVTHQERFEERITQRLDLTPDTTGTDDPDTEPAQPETDRDERLHALRSQVDTVRAAWASRTAKRAGKLFGKKKEEHEQFEQSYHGKVNELGRLELQDQLVNDDLSDTEKNAAVISFLFAEQERLRELTTEKLNGTKVGWFVERMNRGTKMQRIGKAALLGFGFGIGGAMIAGVAGAGLTAGIAVATGRFVRGYTAHDKRGMKKLSDSTTEDDVRQIVESNINGQSSTDRFDATHAHLSQVYERDTVDQQKKRRKAFAMGAGSVALGSAVGYTSFFFGSQLSQVFDGPDLQKYHPFGHNDPTAGPKADAMPNTVPESVPGSNLDPIDAGGSGGGSDLAGHGETFVGYHGTRALTPETLEALHGTMDGYTVRPGDSVWSLSQRFLEDRGVPHPTVYELDATKDALLADLRANGLVDAKGWLTPGDVLRTE